MHQVDRSRIGLQFQSLFFVNRISFHSSLSVSLKLYLLLLFFIVPFQFFLVSVCFCSPLVSLVSILILYSLLQLDFLRGSSSTVSVVVLAFLFRQMVDQWAGKVLLRPQDQSKSAPTKGFGGNCLWFLHGVGEASDYCDTCPSSFLSVQHWTG